VFSSRRHERIEGFHTKPNSTNEKVVGKCRKCRAKLPSKEIDYACKEGISPI
jgi:hypothetical protein